MPPFVPSYKLYASDGSTLVYTFNFVTADNGPQDPFRFTEINGMRGQGSIIVPGSESAWDLNLDFWLIGANYEALIALMDSLQSTIVFNTKYVLKIDRTPSTTVNYNVKRITPIKWDASSRYYSQKGTISFRVGSW